MVIVLEGSRRSIKENDEERKENRNGKNRYVLMERREGIMLRLFYRETSFPCGD